MIKIQETYYERAKVRSIRLLGDCKVRVWLLPDDTFMDHTLSQKEYEELVDKLDTNQPSQAGMTTARLLGIINGHFDSKEEVDGELFNKISEQISADFDDFDWDSDD